VASACIYICLVLLKLDFGGLDGVGAGLQELCQMIRVLTEFALFLFGNPLLLTICFESTIRIKVLYNRFVAQTQCPCIALSVR